MSSDDYEREDGQTDADPLLEKAETVSAIQFRNKRYKAVWIAAAVLLCLILSLWVWLNSVQHSDKKALCQKPAIRREWRELKSSERTEYIRAVKCLSSIPSTLCNGSLHDEFAYVHSRIGEDSHEAAPFLPWHRYFLHIYEETLKNRCQYNGTLPYWDWSYDSLNLTEAPVWSVKEGFGGNGRLDQPIAIGDGRCIQEGPFANLHVQYYNKGWSPHCLSRGFLTEEKYLHHFGALRLNRSAISSVLDESDYFQFLLKLEDGPHSAIPILVRGDFSRFTAPNDPIFFLHHAQIDRLWSRWQGRDPNTRLSTYNGPSSYNSSVAAQLTDLIPMDGLAASVPVSSLMAVNDRFLCYDYSN